MVAIRRDCGAVRQPNTRLVAATLFTIASFNAAAQVSNLSVRAMAANISSGNFQSYEQAGIDIFKALKPDVVAIQEFKAFTGSSGTTNDANIRALVDDAFGTNFYYYKEVSNGFGIPNGIISRWPITNAGHWGDSVVPDRSFAWAQIDLPGTNDLYVVSLHLYSSGSATDRDNEAQAVKANILANFPPNAWILVGGDFNTGTRTEPAVATFKTFLSDAPIPTDAVSGGDPDTNAGRNSPYDYLLPSFSITNYLTSVVMPSQTFPNGLVVDTRVYTPVTDLLPAVATNSGAFQMQHMAIVKNFVLPVFGTNASPVAPSIVTQPQPQTNTIGSPVEFTVTASGTAPLFYQWQFNTTNISGATATNYAIASAQTTNAGSYTVIITNLAGKATSDVATLTVLLTNTPPTITTNPIASQTNVVGSTANFSVTATGTAPLSYQWRFNGTNISAAATNSSFAKANVQTNDAGPYTVVVTNIAGAVTSTVASLTVTSAPLVVAGSNIVISQFYGGGGFTNAGYKNDFVELFNPNSNTVSVAGWAVQYASAAGTSWQQANLTGTIAPYSYYLVMLASNAALTVGITLPTADATNANVNISGTAGKLALTTNGTALSGANPVGGVTIADFVGYGTTASAFEGIGPVATMSGNTNSLLRKNGGYTDSNNNTNDFVILIPPAPRNSASPANPPPSGPPAVAPTLSTPSLSGNQFIFHLTGTATSNYVVQVSTNLALNNWLSLQTNPAPFWFTNNIAQPQQFYRGAVAP